MVRSRLPVLSLLGLFGAVQMLPTKMLMGPPRGLSHAPHIFAEGQKAFYFAVEKYNQDRVDSANYFKQLALLKAKVQVNPAGVREYHLKIQFVKTTCKKEAGKIKKYKGIQKCDYLPRNHEKPTCYFKVVLQSQQYKMHMASAVCV